MGICNQIIALGTAAAVCMLPMNIQADNTGGEADYDIGSGTEMDLGSGNGYEDGCCAPNYSWLGLVGAAAVIAGIAVLIANVEDNNPSHSSTTAHAHS